MSQTHKDEIRLPLAGLTTAYGIGFFIALRGFTGIAETFDLVAQLGATATLTLLGYLVSVVLTGQLEAIPKARLIFLRWNSPLPGGEAFTHWLNSDARIDVAAVKWKHHPLPADRAEQNRLWYKLYKAVASDGAVEDSSKHYLLCRDATFVALVMGLICTGALHLLGAETRTTATFGGISLLAFLMFLRAARLAGGRLVKQVLILNPDVAKPKSKILIS